MMPSYILLTLINDQETHVIGEILSENDEEVVLFRPLSVKVHYDVETRVIRNWVRELMNFSADKRVNIIKNAIATYTTPSPELLVLYKEYMSNEAQYLFELVEDRLLKASSLKDDEQGSLAEAPALNNTRH